MPVIPIVPAVIPRSEAEAIACAKALRFSHEFHLDVVDGNFVPSVCWPYEPLGEPMALKPHTDSYTLEVDLMVAKPIEAARAWVKAGADMLVFHIETIDLASFIDFATYTNVSVGVSAHGDTPVEALFPYLEYADYVQLMGIKMIGLQGQPFDEEVFERISIVREQFPNMPISVDGAVSKDTIAKIAAAGVDRLIVGSAIVKQDNPEAAYRELCTRISG
jgi:ribulose-phosphate 3-epimerase